MGFITYAEVIIYDKSHSKASSKEMKIQTDSYIIWGSLILLEDKL